MFVRKVIGTIYGMSDYKTFKTKFISTSLIMSFVFMFKWILCRYSYRIVIGFIIIIPTTVFNILIIIHEGD